jgi:hypothetical protein
MQDAAETNEAPNEINETTEAPPSRQTLANRANAQKSTGPKTPEGKLASSQNAVKHGLLARSVVLEGEVIERFTALLEKHTALYQPANCIEQALVENLTVARWHQLRLLGMEQAGMNEEMSKQAVRTENGLTVDRDAPGRSVSAFRAMGDNSRFLDLFMRYKICFDRQYDRCEQRLERIRKKRSISKRSHLGEPIPEFDHLSESGTFE